MRNKNDKWMDNDFENLNFQDFENLMRKNFYTMCLEDEEKFRKFLKYFKNNLDEYFLNLISFMHEKESLTCVKPFSFWKKELKIIRYDFDDMDHKNYYELNHFERQNYLPIVCMEDDEYKICKGLDIFEIQKFIGKSSASQQHFEKFLKEFKKKNFYKFSGSKFLKDNFKNMLDQNFANQNFDIEKQLLEDLVLKDIDDIEFNFFYFQNKNYVFFENFFSIYKKIIMNLKQLEELEIMMQRSKRNLNTRLKDAANLLNIHK